MSMNKQRISGRQEPTTGNDPKEKLRLENERLRCRLKNEYGSDFLCNDPIPPEVEQQLLKNVIDFEENYVNAKPISVFEFLGRPAVKNVDEITAGNIEEELEKLINLLVSNNLIIDFGNLTDPRHKYAFITRKLFRRQINNVRSPGMYLHFVHETFYS